MSLDETYERLKQSLVAFIPKYIPVRSSKESPPEFPPILATGFVIREDGLIATNDHVLQAIPKLFKPPEHKDDDWPLYASIFKLTQQGMLNIPLEVLGAFEIDRLIHGKVYYGPPKPDVAFIHVKAKKLPALQIEDSSTLREGIEIATAGFPMGSIPFTAPGKLHQVNPILQEGIVSAILPFPTPEPHAFMINVMVQGGASGSPVFLPDSGKVLGILYGFLRDFGKTRQSKDYYDIPTNYSYVLPSHFISLFLEKIKDDPDFAVPADAKSIEEIIASGKIVISPEYRQSMKIREIIPPENTTASVRKVSFRND